MIKSISINQKKIKCNLHLKIIVHIKNYLKYKYGIIRILVIVDIRLLSNFLPTSTDKLYA